MQHNDRLNRFIDRLPKALRIRIRYAQLHALMMREREEVVDFQRWGLLQDVPTNREAPVSLSERPAPESTTAE
jgi:hypothetical protein